MQFGISECLTHWGLYHSDAPAVSANGACYSYAECNRMIDATSHLIDASFAQDRRIAVAARRKVELLLGIVSILRTGRSVVLLNPGLEDEAIRQNIGEAEVSAFLFDSARFSESLPADARMVPLQPLDHLTSAGPPYVPSTFALREQEWGVLFSSGTSGTPKGIERDHESIVTELLGWVLELELRSGDRFYIGRPLYYTGGLVLALSTLLVGGMVYLNDTDDAPSSVTGAGDVWADYQIVAKQQSLDWAFFLPDQVRRFVAICRRTENNEIFGSKTILVMGAPIDGAEKKEAAELLQSGIVESWGNTESLGTITEVSDIEIRPNSIGRPFLTDRLWIVDERGNPLPPHSAGRIAGNEEAGFCRYANRPEETGQVKRANRIISSDVGYTDADGYFYIHGRVEDELSDGVFLPLIEAELRRMPEIDDCCVLPDSEERQRISVLLIPTSRSKLSEAELEGCVQSALPAGVDLRCVKTTDDLPVLPSGKKDRVKCAQLLASPQ